MVRTGLVAVLVSITAAIAVLTAALVSWAPGVRYSTDKVCQVTGIQDLERPYQFTGVQLTGLTGGVTGTDLGFPFEYNGKLMMLFGDSREFHADRCEPAWCGTDTVNDNPPTGLKRWRTPAHWNAWIASRDEGADSIATAPLVFDPDQCIPASFETDERGSVYAHVISGSIDLAKRLEGPPVASRPEDKWVVFADGRILVITASGHTFVHGLTGDKIGVPFQLSGPPVAARTEDKWVISVGNRLLVVTSDGRVFAHTISGTEIQPAVQLSGDPVAARPEDRWVLAAGDQLLVVTSDGRAFAHAVGANTIGKPIQLTGSPVAARPQDKWVLFVSNRLLVITKDGDVFFHSVDNGIIGTPRRLEGPYVAAQPQDRRVIAAHDRVLVLTGADGRFRPTKLDGRQVGRQEGAIAAFLNDQKIFAFFTMKNNQGYAHDDPELGGRTVLSESTDGARSFKTVLEVSTRKFLWAVPTVEAAGTLRGLPQMPSGDVVLIWGAGRQNIHGQPTPFHHSYPYLAVAPLESIAVRSSWWFYGGPDARGNPTWVSEESLARPVLPFGSPALDRNPRFGPGYHECLGYFNVRRINAWSKWAMIYGCNNDATANYNPRNGPRGIYMRTADLPWGPWSEPQRIFNPDHGYCHFMHRQDSFCPNGGTNRAEESVRDVPKHPGQRGWGAEYAPILLPSRYVKSTGNETAVYFLMGTWNPYQVVLMRTRVTKIPWWERAIAVLQRRTDP